MLIFIGLIVSHPAFAASTEAQQTASTQTDSQDSFSESDMAKRWGVNMKEWHRYKELMSGPRGLWSPNLDPILVLGNHARDAAERRDLARRAAKMEYERAAGEQAWQNAYDLAFAELYGTDIYGTTAPSSWDRLQWRGSFDDPASGLGNTLTFGLRHQVPVDVIVMGAPSDAALRQWAHRHSIPVEQVAAKRITLNHGRPLLSNDTSTAPKVIGIRDSQPSLLDPLALQ